MHSTTKPIATIVVFTLVKQQNKIGVNILFEDSINVGTMYANGLFVNEKGCR